METKRESCWMAMWALSSMQRTTIGFTPSVCSCVGTSRLSLECQVLCSMAQLTLWYFLEGEDIYSSVTLSRDATVDQLRRMIHGQEQITCKASQLELLKVFHSQFQPPFSDGF